ncbi:hypothetical protein ACWC5C_38385 [Streptomyces sp. NPDC001700]
MKAPGYRIVRFEAASDHVEHDFMHATLSDDMYTRLAARHAPDESFLLFYDRAAIWGVPRRAGYVSMHVQRDPGERTFIFESTRRPAVPLVRNWLISQSFPRAASELGHTPGPRPADAPTSRLEDRPLPLASAPASTLERRATAARTPAGAAASHGSSAPAAALAPAPSQGRTRRGPS